MSLTLSRRFIFLRHGQTDWNAEHRCIGQTDIPLNEAGREQAHLVARSPILRQVDGIVSSPLSRALETAQIVATSTHLPLIVDDRLTEANLGVFEGQIEHDESMFDGWFAGTTPEGAEPWSKFCRRVLIGVNSAFSQYSCPLIVSHAAVFLAINLAIGNDRSPDPENGRLLEVDYPRGGPLDRG